MIKRYSKHLIGYGSLLFFVGLFTLNVDIITINVIIPVSTVMVVVGTLGWILKGKTKGKEPTKYVSKVDQGLGFLWEHVIPKFWTGMIILLMIIFNPFSVNMHKKKRNWVEAQELANSYEPITSQFGTELVFGDVNSWVYPNDTTTIFKFKLSGTKKSATNVELLLTHGTQTRLLGIDVVEE